MLDPDLAELNNDIKKRSLKRTRGSRGKPLYVFTGHGVLMLSSVVSGKGMVAVNIQVIRIFARVRQTPRETSKV